MGEVVKEEDWGAFFVEEEEERSESFLCVFYCVSK